MSKTFPGTTIEVKNIEKGSSKILFDGIFATGGITLSQVSVMTGLEPYVVQNWVKRGFLTSPKKRVYSKSQFARIVIINMLRESLQIDKICNLIKVIGGELEDETDDLISDDELYHRYVDMIAEGDINILVPETVAEAAKKYIHDNVGEKITINKICECIGCSKTTLIAAFKKEFGITVNTAITKEKMREAEKLLTAGKLSINEVALATGFYDQSYFSKVFSAEYGISPSEYKKELRN